MANPYGPEQSIYGRSGRVFLAPETGGRDVIPQNYGGDSNWVANATAISATLTVDKLEVRRAGDFWVQHKAGEYTGEGTLTIDKVNSEFEKMFIDYMTGRLVAQDGSRALPGFSIQINLEDRGIKGIQFDANGSPTSGYEAVTLTGVKFWSLPLGYNMADLLSRDLDFNFTGIEIPGRSKTDPAGADGSVINAEA
jgi:hypothetical protein